MKKICLTTLMCLMIFPLFANSKNIPSSFVLVREMQHNLESGFYTLVLNQADQMDRYYPDSRYKDSVLLYRAESYYFLGMRKLSLSVLSSCSDSMNTNYLYGRIYLDDESLDEACKYLKKSYFQSRKDAKNSEKTALNINGERSYFSPDAQKQRNFSCAFLYAYALSLTKDYKTSASVLLQLITDAGYLYDGGKATSLLCEDFYELGRQSRVCEVYEKVEPKLDSFDENYRRKILLMAAISYDNIHKNDMAKKLYEKIMSQNSEGELLSSDEIASFWLRMAIASFNKKDYSDCERCLKVAFENFPSGESENKSLAILYEAALISRTEETKTDAIRILEKNLSSASSYEKDYEAQLCVWYYEKGDIKNVLLYGQKLYAEVQKSYSQNQNSKVQKNIEEKNSVNLALFYYSKALAETGEKEKAQTVLSQIDSNELWFRTTMAKLQSSTKSSFEDIYRDNPSSQEAYENYIIEMISNSDGSFAQDKKLLSLPKGLFYQGIAHYLSSNYASCINSMNGFIRTVSGENLADNENASSDEYADEIALAYYYCAYSNYQLLKNQEAYELFIQALQNLDEKKYPLMTFKANDYAFQCAYALYVLNKGSEEEDKWRNNAISCLENAEKQNVVLDEKIDAVLQLSKFYIEKGENEKSESLLKKYASSSPSSTISQLKCSMELASFYVAQKNFEKSDAIYSSVVSSTYSSQDEKVFSFGENAQYLNGLSYFENQDWVSSQTKFSQYRKDYIGGKKFGTVCYYNACCLKELENANLAVILLQESLNYSLEPALEFKAMYELMKTSRQTGDYEKAINIARRMMKKFPELSKEEKISSQIKEISLLASGETEKTAKLLSDYISNKRENTENGRRIGLELAKKYLSQASKKDEGNKILESIIAQKNNMDLSKEADVLACAIFLKAQQKREENLYTESASQFLEAATVFARYDKEASAKAMYCALEAFDSARLYADSLQTYKAMASQFPQSVWTERAVAIVSDYKEN